MGWEWGVGGAASLKSQLEITGPEINSLLIRPFTVMNYVYAGVEASLHFQIFVFY